MSKHLFALLFLSVLATGAEHAEENLVPNPSFEVTRGEATEAPPWQLPQPVYSISTDRARTGDRSLHYLNDDPDLYRLATCTLDLKSGQRYYFETWVQTRDIQGDDNGATICMEWYDIDGKYLGGAYPHGVKGSVNEWTKVDGVTRPVPEEAARCTVTCYVRKGMTGEAWFDDVFVAEYFPPLLGGVTANRYRGIYDGGDATIFAGVALAEQGLSEEDVSVTLTVENERGTILKKDADVLGEDKAVMTVDMDQLSPGDYTATVRIQTKDGKREMSQSIGLQRVRTLARRHVRVDPHGRTLIEGKPFFPLGTYWSSVTEEHLKIYADSAFNCLMPYSSPNAETMDLIQKYDLKVIYSIKDYYAGSKYCPDWIKTIEDERPAVEKTVKSYRDHPALLAWYINDELPLSMVDRLCDHRQWVEELDPNHPAWVVLYQIADVRRYLPTFDIVGTDPYPIPTHPASRALDWTRRTREATFDCRAVWMVPQIFDWGSYRKKEDPEAFRPPTLLEIRSMAWQCIAAGANGLVFYSWFDLWRMDEKTPFEQRWREVRTMADEIARFIPVILSTEPAPGVTVEASEGVAWRAWEQNQQLFLLIVNSTEEPVSATVESSSLISEAVEEFANEPVRHRQRGFITTLGPLQPVMIRMPIPQE